MKALDIMNFLGDKCECSGDLNREVLDFNSMSHAKEGSLVFCKKGYETLLSNVRSCTILLDKGSRAKIYNYNTYIFVENSRLEFIRIIKEKTGKQLITELFSDMSSLHPKVHPISIAERDDFIHPTVVVGPYSCIGIRCKVDERTTIGTQVYIGGKVKIGKNVHIQSQVTIGTLGFGFERNDKKEFERFPQIGGVVIEDNVEIGAHANIQRGALEDTIIRNGSKIGPYCNIGHNSEIGKHTFVAGGCNFGGGTRIGDFSWIGMGTIVIHNIKIGNNVVVGGGSLIVKDIEDNWLVYGTPAKPVRKRETSDGWI